MGCKGNRCSGQAGAFPCHPRKHSSRLHDRWRGWRPAAIEAAGLLPHRPTVAGFTTLMSGRDRGTTASDCSGPAAMAGPSPSVPAWPRTEVLVQLTQYQRQGGGSSPGKDVNANPIFFSSSDVGVAKQYFPQIYHIFRKPLDFSANKIRRRMDPFRQDTIPL